MDCLYENLKYKELPTVYRLGKNLYGACFWLMKLCVALRMLDESLRRGKIGRAGLVVESTSGTMGYGLALAGRARGLRVQLVGDPAIDASLRNLLELLGVEVIIVTEKLPVGGYQVPRLRRLHDILKQTPGAFWAQQYDNPANQRAYIEPAQAIASRVGRVDILVATCGSGGSISGTSRILRKLGHPARATAVDTHRSVLFGQKDGPRDLRGLGNSIFPRNLDYSLIDEVHWLTAADAFCGARLLFRDHGLDMGPTTGAAFLVARHLAQRNPDKTVVFLGPDRAERYLGTIYSREWCTAQGVWTDELPEAPYHVEHPLEAKGGWAVMDWDRRAIADFINPQQQGVAS